MLRHMLRLIHNKTSFPVHLINGKRATKLLKLRPSKTTVIHALLLRDPPNRVYFCSWLLQSVVEGNIYPQLTFFSDDAWFHLKGYINTQNNRYWISQNPHLTHEDLLHPVKVGVWCALSARRIAGPVFFLTKSLISRDMYKSFSGNSFHT
jgi:hypothetical protein